MITGEERPDDGNIFKPNNYSIGYLGQHINFTKPTVLEEGCQGLGPDDLAGEWKVEKDLIRAWFQPGRLQAKPFGIFRGLPDAYRSCQGPDIRA